MGTSSLLLYTQWKLIALSGCYCLCIDNYITLFLSLSNELGAAEMNEPKTNSAGVDETLFAFLVS